ncbi:MAG: hypothetical protein J5719_06220 [Bacteroidales bacterium]|nr:hypothetical protein [Bacteroidales bacterium]
MPVDFFKDCKKQDCEVALFGLCDDSVDGEHKPAYVDVEDSSKWIANVHNENEICISFYAIDGCVSWKREDGTESGKCDGMLCYDNNRKTLFVELKNRTINKKAWRTDARDQLKDTIACFLKNYDRASFDKVEAYISNKKHLMNQRFSQFCDNFKEDTSITLHVTREIYVV